MNNADNTYFETLKSDLMDLKALWNPDQPITDIRHLVDILQMTVNLSPRSVEGSFRPEGELGHMVAKWMPITFNPNNTHFGLCAEAEPLFAANLRSSDNPFDFSPLIILDNDQPVAIAKTSGEPTIYGLKERRQRNLLPEVIAAQPELSPRLRNLPRRAGAYLMELGDLQADFEPLRLATTIVPSEHRHELTDEANYYGFLNVPVDISAQAIRHLCDQALNDPDARMVQMTEYGSLSWLNKLNIPITIA